MLEPHFSNKFKNRRIKLIDRKEIQLHEIFLDKLNRKRVNEKGETNRKIEVPFSRRSFHLLFICLISLFSILLLRSFQLQVISGEEYFARAERNQFAYMSIEASRGIIFDRNMEQLVFNRPQFLLVLNKEEAGDWESEIRKISLILDIDFKEIMEEISGLESTEVVILNDIKQEELVILEVKIRDLPGFYIEKKVFRYYVKPEILSHLIGYTGKISPEKIALTGNEYSINDYVGKSGIEKSYQNYLRVIPGRIRMERDARGKIHSEEIIRMAESGNNLILWTDFGLQEKIYNELKEMTSKVGSNNAAAVALDPRTGGVLAMVSYPGFDSNLFSGNLNYQELVEIFNDPRSPLFNRIIAGMYPVGSTIKPLIGLAALEEEIITPQTEFYSAGYISIPNPWNLANPSVFRDIAPRGWYNIRKAIADSSNVFFYIIGGGYEDQRGLGADLMKKYLNLFGWGDKTGVDIPGEKEGFIPNPEWKKKTLGDFWRIGDNYNMSIGQGYMSATPLQVAVAFSAIANKGRLLRPMTVRKIIDGDGNKLKVNETEVINENLVNSDNLRTIREGMRDAVDYGSATLLKNLPVRAGAKTGTSQIPRAGHYHHWVTVFAPYDNPEIVIVILIEEVEGIRAATLPVAKNVLKWYFSSEDNSQNYEKTY